MSTEWTRKLRRWLTFRALWLAPPGTRRWWLLRAVYRSLRYGPGALISALWSQERPLEDPYDRTTLNTLIRPFGQELAEVPSLSTLNANPLRYMLEFLVAHPQIRRRFPRALSERNTGAFALWLEESEAAEAPFNIPRQAVPALRAVLAAAPGQRVVHWLDHDILIRALFPLALTPEGRGGFLHWLLRNRVQLECSLDDILAFVFCTAEDPSAGLVHTYLRSPLWQTKVPQGLTPAGWDELKSWVGRHYRIRAPWLASARPIGPAHFVEHLEHPEPSVPVLQNRNTIPQWTVGQGVNVLGHFRYPSGLQVAASNTVAALEMAGWAVSCRDVPSSRIHDRPGREDLLGLHPYSSTIVHLAPEPLVEDSYPHSGLALRKNTYRIGYWYWELEQVPSRWRRHSRWLHELWAPTRFIGDALRRGQLGMPVVDMLAGMRMPPVVQLPRTTLGLPEDKFLFLFVFDMASSFQRKNPLAVVRAFRRAFRSDEPVALAIKVSRGPSDPMNFALLRQEAEQSQALVIDAVLPIEQLFALMNACDAYVSLHRSEGYGLTMAEAMALSKPVIATAYSGNLDFMTNQNSLLVDYQLAPLAQTEHLYRRGCLAAEPSIEQAAVYMRRVYEQQDWARALGARAAREIRDRLGLESAGKRMAARLEAIESVRQEKELRRVS